MSGPSLGALKAMVIRHRLSIQDMLLIAVVLTLGALLAWQYKLFPDQPLHTQERVIELDEMLALVAMGGTLFAGSRLRAQRSETRRRTVAEAEVRSLAFEDPLTGLPNRRQFDDALKAALAAPPRAGAAHAVFMLDLNGFKRINDLHGHPVGDEALMQVAMRLRTAVRDEDLVARLGGDEFAVLSRHVSGPEAATGLARRIVERLDEPVTAGSRRHRLGTGIGIALFPQDGFTARDLIRKADVALYRAKQEGHCGVHFFEQEMDVRLRERDRLEADLRAAIGTPAIRPFYQPLADIRTGAITGFEALARWNHPERGELDPDRFIPIADDTGMIGELSDHLLRQACRDARAWPEPIRLSFNISPVQLRDVGLARRVLAILAETGLDPHRLELEITESALVQDLHAAQTILTGLREVGVRIALDDFGTGYSSLYHLRNFKLDKIKIDRSFIDSMGHDHEAATIVRALIGLGSGLGLQVTAEGVADGDQRRMLAQEGCDEGQGFLFSKAVPAAEALALIFGLKGWARAE
jgi:diguanylate cyclase (GGDEF)-like protein